MMLGSYILDSFNDDNILTKIKASLVLFFFGGILLIYELSIADKVAEWWGNSNAGFYWRLYVSKSYDNMESQYLKILEEQISQEKDKNSIFYKHLKLILKRNGR